MRPSPSDRFARPMRTYSKQLSFAAHSTPRDELHDGTAQEVAAYDDRCQQIARGMLFGFERLAAIR